MQVMLMIGPSMLPFCWLHLVFAMVAGLPALLTFDEVFLLIVG